MESDGFRRFGDPELRLAANKALAEHLGVAEIEDVQRALEEMLRSAEAGRLSNSALEALDDATRLVQRIEAFDSVWVFGQRYMRHKFVSTDPLCPNCKNTIPHRTMLMCPTCSAPGPWIMEEMTVQSSYVHYFLAEQLTRLLEARLLMPGEKSYADGTTTALPRGGAKSTWLCEIAGAWLTLTGRSRCLLLFSNTSEQVAERVNELKTEFEENTTIIDDFGVLQARRQDPRTWTKSDFTLPNGSRVVGRGAMQSMRGVKNRQYRPDAVIADDVDDEKFTTTPEQASKMWDWWDTRVIPACHPNAVFMFHGTVIGEMGLLWQVLNGHRGITYSRRVFKAIQDFPGCERCGMPHPHAGAIKCQVCGHTKAIQPSSYWGARFTVQALKAIRSKIGHWAWQTEFEQSPHDNSTSWFQKEWIDEATRDDLAPLTKNARRILPFQAIGNSLSGEEAVKLATMADSRYRQVPGDLGPYQVIVQSWDPAWAREQGKSQMTAWMAGVGMGLTWDDTFDIFWLDRDRGLTSNAAYRKWMYDTWVESITPMGGVERPGQLAMIIESNSAGVLFQFDIEEHWGSIPLINHQTGAEKHDLVDGIPGLASTFEKGKIRIRRGGSEKQRLVAEELVYELKNSGRSQYKDVLMATWFAWSYISRWMRDVRDPARYEELARREAAKRRR